MDIHYAVQQLDLEIRQDEQRLADKKISRKRLFSVLSDQEKALVEEAARKSNAPPNKT